MDTIKGYRTVIFNVVMTIGTLVTLWTGVQTEGEVQIINENLGKILTSVVLVWGAGGVILRRITNTPIFKNYG